MCKNNNDCSCFVRILENIIRLQQKGDDCDDFNGCDKPFLGNLANVICLNTRPITLYGCSGNQFAFPFTLDCETGTSNVFRIENLDNNCAKFRVLAPNPDTCTKNNFPFVATNDFFTIDLNCVCAIKCLMDTFVSGI